MQRIGEGRQPMPGPDEAVQSHTDWCGQVVDSMNYGVVIIRTE